MFQLFPAVLKTLIRIEMRLDRIESNRGTGADCGSFCEQGFVIMNSVEDIQNFNQKLGDDRDFRKKIVS